MFKNILVPLDGSENAERTIKLAIDMAKIFDAKVTLMQIAEILPVLKKDKEAEKKVLLEKAEGYLSRVRKGIEEQGISTDVVAKTGKPYLEICNYADREDVDIIVLSSYGAGSIENWAIGSVSDKVLRHSIKPVLFITPPIISPLMGKVVLAVDDEPDILETVEEQLDMCMVHKASDYNTAIQYLQNRIFDIVILDIMGVNGFELLKESVLRGFPTVMLTAHALTSEAVEKSARLGAVSFIPKEKIDGLDKFLEDVIAARGRPVWSKLFDKIGDFFYKHFGSEWKGKETLLKEFEDAMK